MASTAFAPSTGFPGQNYTICGRKTWARDSSLSATSVESPTKRLLSGGGLVQDAQTASCAWAGRVSSARAAIKRTGEPYKQPSQAAPKKAWMDLRTHSKIHCSSAETDIARKINRAEEGLYRNTGEPAIAEVTEWRWAARYGFCFPSAIYPDRETALAAFAAWRRRVGFPAPTICQPPHGNRRHVDVVEEWECKHRKERVWPAADNKIKGAKARRVPPNAEHGGNICVPLNPQRLNFATGRKGFARGVISYGIDVGYGNCQEDCVSEGAKLRSKEIDNKKSPRRRRETEPDWNDLARLARGGDSNAYNKILVAARPFAERMERSYQSHSSNDLLGDLVVPGLYGAVNKKTGKLGSGVWYAIANWDEMKNGGFRAFMLKAIRWGMLDHIKQLPKIVSLNAPLSEEQGEDCFQDLITAEDVYGVYGHGDEFDYDAARSKLDEIMKDRLTDREREVITRRRLLNGVTVIPTLEQLGDEMDLSRETIRKDEIAAEQKIGLRG